MKRKLYLITLLSAMTFSITACGTKKDTITTNTDAYETSSTESQAAQSESTVDEKDKSDSLSDNTTNPDKTDVESYDPEFTFTQMPKDMFMWALEQQSVYEMPTADSKLVYFSAKEEKFEILAVCKENGWYKIQCPNTVGYIDSIRLTDIDPKASKNEPKGSISENNSSNSDVDKKTDTAPNKTEDTIIEDEELKQDEDKSASTNTQSKQPSDKPKTTEPKTNPNLPSFDKSLYSVAKYDETAVYWYYIVGQENSNEMQAAMKTAQTDLNALKKMYYQTVKVCDIGTYSQGTIAIYIAETFDTNATYTANMNAKINAITSNITNYK